MKFVHIADLHLGKGIHQWSLIDVQRELLFELLTYMDQRDIRILIIAGDIYDRLIPSQEAVHLLDEFLSAALLDYQIEVFMISGNHDSSDRLHFASALLSSRGLHIETHVKKEMHYVERGNTRFYFLPFVKPSHIRNLYEIKEIATYQEALSLYFSHQSFDPHYKNILITHQFVGRASIVSESEVPLSVGGSEIIDVSLFDAFDYVALGHLHAPQSVSRDTIRYSGSLMRYSFDEVHQNKTIVIVETNDMSIKQHALHPSLTLEKYQVSFEQVMDPTFIEKKDDFLAFELTNESLVPHAIEQLRVLYPRLLQLTYSYLLKQQKGVSQHSIESLEQMDTLGLFAQFYKAIKDDDLSHEQSQIVQEYLERAGVNNEDN